MRTLCKLLQFKRIIFHSKTMTLFHTPYVYENCKCWINPEMFPLLCGKILILETLKKLNRYFFFHTDILCLLDEFYIIGL